MFRPASFAATLVFALSIPVVAAAATSGTPYQDPSAIGALGLCDQAGHEITSGNVNAAPFVWRVVSSSAATAPYNVNGRTATLYAYQPRQQVPAGDWSGDQLTASSRYSNPSHPMAQATNGDESLADFIAEFAPQWDGLLQLRLYLGAPNQPVNSFQYAATSIKVTGNTWHVVNPVTVSCTDGKAESIESILLPAHTTNGTHHSATQGHRQHPGAHRGNPTHQLGGSTSAPGSAPATVPVAAAESTSSGHHGLQIALLVVGAVALVGGSAIFAYRKPRRAST